MSEDKLVLCYNRGCGQKYDPDKNSEGKVKKWKNSSIYKQQM